MKRTMITIYLDDYKGITVKYHDKILMLKEGYDLKFANDLLNEIQSFKNLLEKKYRKSVK